MIQKEKFIKVFIFLIILLVLFFLADLFFGLGLFGLKSIVFANFQDYLADFFNHARLAADEYVYKGPVWSLAERGLPPLQYCIFERVAKAVDYSAIPTIFLSGRGFSIGVAQGIYFANYLICVISVLFFVYLYENLRLKNKYMKFLLIFSFLVSTPFIFFFERGNSVILAVFAVAVFMFNYEADNKIHRELSLLALAFASALKLYPFLFIIVLIFKKRYKDICKVFAYSFILTLIAFLCLKGGLSNIHLFIHNFICNYHTYHNSDNKFFIFLLLGLCFLIPFYKDEWKKFCAVILLIMAFNSFSGYRMLYFLPIIVLFLNKKEFEKLDIAYGLSLILLICPIKVLNVFGYILLSGSFLFELIKEIFIRYKSINKNEY